MNTDTLKYKPDGYVDMTTGETKSLKDIPKDVKGMLDRNDIGVPESSTKYRKDVILARKSFNPLLCIDRESDKVESYKKSEYDSTALQSKIYKRRSYTGVSLGALPDEQPYVQPDVNTESEHKIIEQPIQTYEVPEKVPEKKKSTMLKVLVLLLFIIIGIIISYVGRKIYDRICLSTSCTY